LTKEGVGETSGQAAEPQLSESVTLPQAGSVEETSFLRSVRILPAKGGAAVSPERTSGSKFGSDVFADALVPSEPGKSCRHPLFSRHHSPDVDGRDPAVPFGRSGRALA